MSADWYTQQGLEQYTGDPELMCQMQLDLMAQQSRYLKDAQWRMDHQDAYDNGGGSGGDMIDFCAVIAVIRIHANRNG